MNEQYSTPDDGREWVPAETWKDVDESHLLAASVETEANYSYEEQT